MRFELKDYQDDAARRVLSGLRRGSNAWADVGDREYGAVSLAAPTGAGKTVIAAAVVERMWFGDPDGADAAPNPSATFLWITDDPSLNEQTRKKMLEASERIQPGQLVTVDDGFDQPTFDAGKVYFLNAQKLGKATNFVKRRQGVRRFPLWETMTNTITARGGDYYVIVDEAHRGTGTRTGAKEQKTNVGRVIHGATGVVAPAPVVWGISATPERFIEAVRKASPARPLREVSVAVDDVRASGLLKDRIGIHFQGEDQSMTATLLRAAVDNIVKMDEAWKTYTDTEGGQEVKPILVLQVPDEASFSSDRVGDALDECVAAWPELVKTGAVRHSLGEHKVAKFGSHAVDYIAPQNIQDNPRVRLVVAKEALTTGWDCPRAETMVSLRTARDITYIAQLVGRMVRAPLARRIEADDALNRVSLFLPHFDEKAVTKVVEGLNGDSDGLAGTTEVVVDPVDVGRNAAVPAEALAMFEALPSYLVPRALHRSQVARLHKLAALLVADGLVDKAPSVATAYLIGVLEAERARLDADGTLAALIADVGTATTATIDVVLHGDDVDDLGLVDLELSDRDLDFELASAGRVFRDGLADDYWGYLVAGGMEPRDAKILVASLARDTATRDKVETDAEKRVQAWLHTHLAGIETTCSDDQLAKYRQVQAATRNPELTHPKLPAVRTMPGEGTGYVKHFFADATGNFVPAAKGWEVEVLDVELGRPDTAAWYRNPNSGNAALHVPYRDSGAPSGYSAMHPDFVFFAPNSDGVLSASIVDPHGHHLADAPAKLRGLADYAHDHGEDYDRILGVIKMNGAFYQLNLKNPDVRSALKDVNEKAGIEQVFTDFGSLYA